MPRKRTKPSGQADRAKAEGYFVFDLPHVKANTYQRRDRGVIGNLSAVGFGLFERLKGHEDKEPLWEMLTGGRPARWALAVGLLDEYEPDIKELAGSIAAATQLHNVGVVPADGSDAARGYDVAYGMRRCLARAYNHARSLGELPLTVKAEIAKDTTDPNDLCFTPVEGGRGREGETLIDEAQRIRFLKRQGLTIPQIADRLATNQQNVRNRLRLTPEDQRQVHTGRLGMVDALKLFKRREGGEAPADASATDTPTSRKRTHTVEQMGALYTAVEKPDDCTDELWAVVTCADVRRYFALLLGVEFTTFEDMVKAKKKCGRQAPAVGAQGK